MMQEESSVEEKDISRAVIKRLPRYYRYLGELMEDGVERISSNELSGRMKVLGLDRTHNMIIVGAGNLGQALANYTQFEKQGFKIVGIFDVNPVMQGVSVRGIEIRMIDELPEFVKDNHVEIATLTLPKAKALDMAKLLVDVGVKAIWNFAHTDLNLFMPEDVIVENVHLSESLMRLSYNLSRFEKDHKQEQGKI